MEVILLRFHGIGEVTVALDPAENPSTVSKLSNALPFRSVASRWGDEVYFETPVKHAEEKGRVEMEVGAVAYWPRGKAMCIFFGPTPVSQGDRPKAYSPVNFVGTVEAGLDLLSKIEDGCQVTVSRGR